jgi:hypothetical protein
MQGVDEFARLFTVAGPRLLEVRPILPDLAAVEGSVA